MKPVVNQMVEKQSPPWLVGGRLCCVCGHLGSQSETGRERGTRHQLRASKSRFGRPTQDLNRNLENRGRHHLTIKASPDRGLTWPIENRLLLDEEKSAGYSCMTMIDEKTVGILYEGSQAHMTFQRIPLEYLVSSKPR